MILPLNQVIIGDSGEVMAEWPVNSVDCVVTDPPYRIGFMGSSWDRALPPRRVFRQIFRVLKPGAIAFIMSSPRQDVLWRMLAMLDGIGFNLRTSFIVWIYRTGFPKSYDVSKGIDRKLALERKTIGKNPSSRPSSKKHGGGDFNNIKGEGSAGIQYLTEPASDLAKKWEGWKSQTGLKPAAEVVLMVNKPFSESTIVDNVLKWGTGAINVDACRIPLTDGGWERSTPWIEDIRGNRYNQPDNPKSDSPPQKANDLGRFPANLLARARADEGSPYRYFDLDAWAEYHGFIDVAKPSKAERDRGLWRFQDNYDSRIGDGIGEAPSVGGSRQNSQRNIHPTVKPIKLMAYLIELGCPQKGIVVDPFLGSGTTCIAAKKLRRQWIGIEINPEYAEIARARIDIRGPLDQYVVDRE